MSYEMIILYSNKLLKYDKGMLKNVRIQDISWNNRKYLFLKKEMYTFKIIK